MQDFKIEDTDLYELFGIEISSTVNEIKKAYRKKALQCHPDKNPDKPNAATLFQQLSKALEVLCDESARKAYDRVLKGKKEAALRHKELDSKRRKLKENLEAKERASSYKTGQSKDPHVILQAEIERLRKEGSRQIQEELDYVKRQLKKEQKQETTIDENYRVKIKWKTSKHDPTNGGYSEELLNKFLCKYGDITVLVVSAKKQGSALVEFKTQRAAQMAVDLEKGLLENPLTLSWVNEATSTNKCNHFSSTIKASDYESVVLTKMRQAEERKRLIAQMQAEDNE